MSLGYTEERGSVAEFPVAELVGKDSNNFFSAGLFNEGIIDHNVLLPWEAEEVSIRMGRALGAVDNVEFGKGELVAVGKLVNLGLELSIFKRGELIEEREDPDGVDGDHDELQSSSEGPEVEDEAVASGLNNLEETCDDRRDESGGEEV